MNSHLDLLIEQVLAQFQLFSEEQQALAIDIIDTIRDLDTALDWHIQALREATEHLPRDPNRPKVVSSVPRREAQ